MTRHVCDSGFPWCPPDTRAGDFYKLRVKDLSPTQFAVAQVMEEIKDKSRYELCQLFGEDAFGDILGDLMQAYQAQKI